MRVGYADEGRGGGGRGGEGREGKGKGRGGEGGGGEMHETLTCKQQGGVEKGQEIDKRRAY